MNNKNEPLHTLKEIHSIMERSSRFISLSGLSGIFAGIFALLGAAIAYIYLLFRFQKPESGLYNKNMLYDSQTIVVFFAIAIVVLVLAIGFGILFTTRNSRKKGLPVWDATTKRLISNLLIPLAVGGIFTILLFWHGYVFLIASSTLIFYGLALINASHYTLGDIRYLGIFEVIIGILAVVFVGYGLLFWALGFGIMHIVYGTIMYFKYEHKDQ